MPAKLSSEGNLLDYQLPKYRYYPTQLLPSGTRHWARVQFLQACERLGIPAEKWPRFERLVLPPKANYLMRVPDFKPPAFDFLRESPLDWRYEAEQQFRAHCDGFLQILSAKIDKGVAEGVLTKIAQPKGGAPVALRFEWAAQRYCLRAHYKDLATKEYNDAAIRKIVNRVLMSVGLGGRDREPR